MFLCVCVCAHVCACARTCVIHLWKDYSRTGNNSGLWGGDWGLGDAGGNFTVKAFVSFALWTMYYLCSKVFKRTKEKIMHPCSHSRWGWFGAITKSHGWDTGALQWLRAEETSSARSLWQRVAGWGVALKARGMPELQMLQRMNWWGEKTEMTRKSPRTPPSTYAKGPFQICDWDSTG